MGNVNAVKAIFLLLVTFFALSNLNIAAAILPCTGAHAIGSMSCSSVSISNSIVDIGQEFVITVNGISGGIAPYTANWIYFSQNVSNGISGNTITGDVGSFSFTGNEMGIGVNVISSNQILFTYYNGLPLGSNVSGNTMIDLPGSNVIEGEFTLNLTINDTASNSLSINWPSIRHIIVVYMENKPVNFIVGNVSAPYQSHIIKQYAFAADYYGVAHPSLPNYIALIAGTINGGAWDCGEVVGPGCVISNSTNTLVNLLQENASLNWTAYSESMSNSSGTMPCWLDIPNSSLYYPKHYLFVYLAHVTGGENSTSKSPQGNAYCKEHVLPLGNVTHETGPLYEAISHNNLANFTFIQPNICDDAHNCPTIDGDNWLSKFIPSLTNKTVFNSTAIFVTYDEATGINRYQGFGNSHGGQVYTAVISPLSKQGGYNSTIDYSYYSILATTEKNFHLGNLGRNDGTAVPMRDFFTISSLISPALSTPILSASPNIIINGSNVTLTASWSGGTANYAAVYYSGSSPVCSSDDTLVASSNNIVTNSNSVIINPNLSKYYCVKVRDSASTPQTQFSNTVLVTVTVPTLQAGGITPSSPKIDQGQSITLNATPTSGTTPYSYQWYTATASGSCSSSDTKISGANSLAYIASPTSDTYYCYIVNDSELPSATKDSNTIQVKVRPTFVNPQISSNTTMIGKFNGLDSHSNTTENVFNTNNGFTLSFWMYFNSSAYNGSKHISLVDFFNQTFVTESGLFGGTPPNSYGFHCNNACYNNGFLFSSYEPPIKKWQSAIYIYNKTNGNMYIALNGIIKITSTSFSGASENSVIPLDSGLGLGNPEFSSIYLNGSLANVQFYNQSFNQSYITEIYDSGITGKPVNTEYLAGWWPLNDNAIDLSGKGHNLMVFNISYALLNISSNTVYDVGQNVTFIGEWSGGTPPYSANWIVPGANVLYSGLNPPTNTATTTNTLSVPASDLGTGSHTAKLSVTDNSSVTDLLNTNVLSFTVDSALGTPTISSNSNNLDSGEPSILTVTWSGGTSPYTIRYYSGTSSSCQSDTDLIAEYNITGTSNTLSIAPKSNTYYCSTITDSATIPLIVDSATKDVVVNPILSSASIRTSPILPATLDSGETVAFYSNWSGGTSPYTVNYILTNTLTGKELAKQSYITPDVGNNFKWLIPNTLQGNTLIANVLITDSAGFEKINSTDTNTLSINPALNITNVYPDVANTYYYGNAINFSVTWSGGTPNYTVNWSIKDVNTGSLVSNSLLSRINKTSNYFVWDWPSADEGSVVQANVIVTDSANVLNTKTILGSDLTLKSTSAPSSSGGSEGGGSVGSSSSSGGNVGGGRGIHYPNTTISNNGYLISSFSQINFVILKLNDKNFKITESDIEYNHAYLIVNGYFYLLYLNKSVFVTETPLGGYYLKLLNISLLPLENTISVKFYFVPKSLNQTFNVNKENASLSMNLTGNYRDLVDLRDANSILTITSSSNSSINPSTNSMPNITLNAENITNNSLIAPIAYKKLLAIDLNASGVSGIIINMSYMYNCSINSSLLTPFIILNGTWSKIKAYSLNNSACKISFQIPNDPIIGIMERLTVHSNTTNMTSNTTTTTPNMNITTSTNATNQSLTSASLNFWGLINTHNYLYIALAAILILVIVLFIKTRAKKPQGTLPIQQ